MLHDLHVDIRHLLHLLQDVEATTAAVSLQGVRRIRDLLQLPKHELGNHQGAFQEAGGADVRNTTVDDDRGVQNLVLVEPRGILEGSDDPRRLKPLAFGRADDQAYVYKGNDQEEAQEV